MKTCRAIKGDATEWKTKKRTPSIRELKMGKPGHSGGKPGHSEFFLKTILNVPNAAAEHFMRRTGWQVSDADWSRAELDRIEALIAEKYSQPDWNSKR